ncbi:MAG TPA: hypothetical protein VGZ32_14930 [Actinocrinis sp.]|uniref:hypothetical protein n=1 Tax=Actinocrinis sp. TaxID=1920516 RepID=UPI002DDD703E|nr:hypothetical protein [Actinocrinis sp.]HEV3171643.1 hypothetical protein [Actinocrinis sp.]
MSKDKKKDRSPVKVPKNKIGRAVFFGGQAAAALAAIRTIKDARAKGDTLALLHGALTASVLAVTALIAVRTVRETRAAEDAAAPAEPLMLTAGK